MNLIKKLAVESLTNFTGTPILSLLLSWCKFTTVIQPTEANICIGAWRLKFCSSNTIQPPCKYDGRNLYNHFVHSGPEPDGSISLDKGRCITNKCRNKAGLKYSTEARKYNNMFLGHCFIENDSLIQEGTFLF